MIDTQLLHYRIVEKLGEGGMAVVYRAQDSRLGREVALKVLPAELASDPERLERFAREARTLASLNHPNIVTVYSVEEARGVRFLTMELVEGRSLGEVIPPEGLPLGRFFDLAVPLADAVAAAHERDIVHRDLKPGNVMVTEAGAVKVLDFGLAKQGALSGDRTSEGSASLTGDRVLGTVPYLAPEQLRGRPADRRADLFALGAILYQMLTGRRAFGGESAGETMSAILRDAPPPVTALRSGLPRHLERIVRLCLHKDPEHRTQSAKDVRNQLEDLRAEIHSGAAAGGSGASPAASAADRMGEAPTLLDHTAPTALARPALEQDLRFCTTADGARLAYSVVGSGPPLVRVLGHFTHLEMEWEWPDLRRFWECLAAGYTVVRYDGRGIGLSDPFSGEFSEVTRQLDLDAVLDAVGAERAALLGISEGGWTAARYCHDHPDRISHLILFGGYSRGAQARPDYDREEDAALITLIRKGWGRDTPSFRQVFTGQFFADDADPGLIAHFNEMQRASADPETAARYHESCHTRADGRAMFERLTTPTLVVHCREDRVVPAEEGRLLASIIPGARLVLLPSGSHYFPTDRHVVTKVVEAVTRFLHEEPPD